MSLYWEMWLLLLLVLLPCVYKERGDVYTVAVTTFPPCFLPEMCSSQGTLSLPPLMQWKKERVYKSFDLMAEWNDAEKKNIERGEWELLHHARRVDRRNPKVLVISSPPQPPSRPVCSNISSAVVVAQQKRLPTLAIYSQPFSCFSSPECPSVKERERRFDRDAALIMYVIRIIFDPHQK